MTIKYKVFTGTIAEVERDFNAWAKPLPDGTNISPGPILRMPDGDGERWLKEVTYNEPDAGRVPIAIARQQPS